MNNTLTEVSTKPLLLCESAISKAEIHISKLFSTHNPVRDVAVKGYSLPTHHKNIISASTLDSESGNPFDSYESDTVVIIPIIGLMFKYSTIDWEEYKYVPGMDLIANLIRMANASDKIAGIVLLVNTPGGTTQSIYQLEDALRNRTKPCVAVVDGMCMSGGMYAASFCDKIFAVNRMCELGSIGTFAKILDDSKFYEKNGLKIISVYPPESKYKNLAVREAIEGKPERLIDEQLTPFAIHFQNIIKENRPNLDASAEGILEGAEFYAYDALKYGLIDGIKNIDEAVAETKNLANRQKQFYSQFKN